jgi:phospholipase C
LGAATIGGAALGTTSSASAASPPAVPASLRDIEHVVMLMMENRSFDHYFGTMSGVRGFSDPDALRQSDGMPVFYQPDFDLVQNVTGHPYILPWHLDTKTMSAQNAQELGPDWILQHLSWNQGSMDGFVTSHRLGDDLFEYLSVPVTNYAPLTMGYFTEADIPFHRALADGFTICDHYFSSVMSMTVPNRIMFWSGTINPEMKYGTKVVVDDDVNNGQLEWESYPERLQQAGIDWYVYQEDDTLNDLICFRGLADPSTDAFRRANSIIPTPANQPFGPALAAKLRQDVVSGNLPQVSWIIPAFDNCEHPQGAPGYGAYFISQVLDALMADPKVWAKTAFILNYDENDGFFDHVTPPVPPPGTPGEYLSPLATVQSVGKADGFDNISLSANVGLGFRVPMLVISPFSRGGLCSSEVLDHTSVLQFLETRFGVEVPYVSQWRRDTVGDLTSAFNFAGTNDLSLPELPNAEALAVEAIWQRDHLPAPTPPKVQSMPVQDPGPPRPRPSGPV